VIHATNVSKQGRISAMRLGIPGAAAMPEIRAAAGLSRSTTRPNAAANVCSAARRIVRREFFL
jgi:hypothetical protein